MTGTQGKIIYLNIDTSRNLVMFLNQEHLFQDDTRSLIKEQNVPLHKKQQQQQKILDWKC